MARLTKKDIYKEYDINYFKAGKTTWHIETPIGHMPPVLVKGNEKIGNVWHFSMLAGTIDYDVTLANGEQVTMCGTCNQDCDGGYCKTGRYVMQPIKNSLANKTELAREHMEFLKRAIMAQIKADHIKLLRIHVTGDFFSRSYLNMWKEIIAEYPAVTFWTYTKEQAAENEFDCFPNANIVKSNIENIGYNFGHADYLIAVYKLLKDLGKTVYICRCGFDDDQHCDKCAGCALCEHVLFLEHGTEYDAKADPAYKECEQLVMAQGDIYLTK